MRFLRSKYQPYGWMAIGCLPGVVWCCPVQMSFSLGFYRVAPASISLDSHIRVALTSIWPNEKCRDWRKAILIT